VNQKIEGIVLQKIKYTDNSIIVNLYTKEYGRITCIVKGIHNKKTKSSPAYFTPLNILNADINYFANKDIHLIKEISLCNDLENIRENYQKVSICLFLSELLNKVIKYSANDSKLFEYIKIMLVKLNSETLPVANFHIFFLIELTHYLGFYPFNNYDKNNCYFDLLNATFINTNLNIQTANKENSFLFSKFLEVKSQEYWSVQLNSAQRKNLLNTIISYYVLHTGINLKINSIDVLTEVFK